MSSKQKKQSNPNDFNEIGKDEIDKELIIDPNKSEPLHELKNEIQQNEERDDQQNQQQVLENITQEVWQQEQTQQQDEDEQKQQDQLHQQQEQEEQQSQNQQQDEGGQKQQDQLHQQQEKEEQQSQYQLEQKQYDNKKQQQEQDQDSYKQLYKDEWEIQNQGFSNDECSYVNLKNIMIFDDFYNLFKFLKSLNNEIQICQWRKDHENNQYQSENGKFQNYLIIVSKIDGDKMIYMQMNLMSNQYQILLISDSTFTINNICLNLNRQLKIGSFIYLSQTSQIIYEIKKLKLIKLEQIQSIIEDAVKNFKLIIDIIIPQYQFKILKSPTTLISKNEISNQMSSSYQVPNEKEQRESQSSQFSQKQEFDKVQCDEQQNDDQSESQYEETNHFLNQQVQGQEQFQKNNNQNNNENNDKNNNQNNNENNDKNNHQNNDKNNNQNNNENNNKNNNQNNNENNNENNNQNNNENNNENNNQNNNENNNENNNQNNNKNNNKNNKKNNTKLQIAHQKYEIHNLSLIDEGGFHKIYKTCIIIPKINKPLNLVVKKDGDKSKLKKEIQFMKKCFENSYSKYIAQIYYIQNNYDEYQLKFYHFKSLREYQQKYRNVMSLKRKIKILKQLAKGIQDMHKIQILHLDIKPDNILISKKGRVKICDFGEAYHPQYPFQRESVKFSVPYTAPEIMQKNDVTDKADVFSFGVVAYELLIGKLPIAFMSKKDYIQQFKSLKFHLDEDSAIFQYQRSPRQILFNMLVNIFKCLNPLKTDRLDISSIYQIFNNTNIKFNKIIKIQN